MHFTNFSDVDLDKDVIHFKEGETHNIECKVEGGVPVPMVHIKVGEHDYTNKFEKNTTVSIIMTSCDDLM